MKANKASPTFTGTVTGSNLTITGTLNKGTVLAGADLLAQIATNKEDTAIEKSRIDTLPPDHTSNRLLLTNIEAAYKAADIGVSTTLTSLQSQHNSDIINSDSVYKKDPKQRVLDLIIKTDQLLKTMP